jgi:hypothetical protein
MVHANAQERGSLIAGLRSQEVDRIAALIGAKVDDQSAEHGNYTAAQSFGPVGYRAVFIPANSREYREAKASYANNIIPGAHEEV